MTIKAHLRICIAMFAPIAASNPAAAFAADSYPVRPIRMIAKAE